MSQSVFARLLNVSTKTLQSWGQGVRQPSDASRRLLQVFSEQPEMLCKIVGLPEISLSGVQTQRTTSGQRRVAIVNRSSKPRAAGKSGRAHQQRSEFVGLALVSLTSRVMPLLRSLRRNSGGGRVSDCKHCFSEDSECVCCQSSESRNVPVS